MINWQVIAELKEEIGQDDFAEVIEIFLEEVEEAIANLRLNPAPDTFESRLHFLKGSALNLGFQAFSERCQAGESAAAQGMPDIVDLSTILACYEASKEQFIAGLKARRDL